MRRRAIRFLVVLLGVCLPAVSFGQEIYPGRWWHVPPLREKLQLTDKERRQLDGLYDGNRRRLVELKEEIKREQAELRDLLEFEPLKEQSVMAQARRLEAIRSDLALERLRYVLDVRKILGPERFQQLKRLYRSSPQIRVPVYPGGPLPKKRPWYDLE